jgi:hypothetical protein
MNDSVRIRFSVGLVFVAIVHAVLVALMFTVLHQTPAPDTVDDGFKVPDRGPSVPSARQIETLRRPAQVNLEAQGEVKQQQIVFCPPQRVVAPVTVRRVVNQPAPQTTPSGVTPASVPSTGDPLAMEPAPTPVTKPVPTTPRKMYQLALFVTDDSQSQQLQEWFDTNPRLVTLKDKCEFQVYTAANAIYRTRFAEIVPADQFPVVLFQDSTGGHIHAAGRTMIPRSADELYSDLRRGYELYQQAKQAEKTGAVKNGGYSWDDAISPTLYLSAEDCPDGYCPVEPADSWRPGDRLRDGLFDRDSIPTRNALMWVSAGEIATVALIGVAVVLLGFILLKRGL